MSETTAVPTFHVPSQNELNQLVEQQYKATFENNPALYFHAWENQGVHKDALKDQASVIELDPDKTELDFNLWEQEVAADQNIQDSSAHWEHEARQSEAMMSKEDIIAFTIPAGKNLVYERHLVNMN